MAENKKMKTLTLGGETFEVTDEVARNEISKIKEEGSGGVQSDLSQNDATAPDYVKNRTHYEAEEIVNEPLNITWDGNTEGLVSVEPFYKVSDALLTDEQIKSATVVFNGETIAIGDVFDTIEVSEELVGSDFIVFCRKAGAAFGPFTFPEIGIYFVSMGEMYVSSLTTTEPIEHTKTVVHKLDKKYLPDDVGGKVEVVFETTDMQAKNYRCNLTYAEIEALTNFDYTKLSVTVKRGVKSCAVFSVYMDGYLEVRFMYIGMDKLYIASLELSGEGNHIPTFSEEYSVSITNA
jgi:hypothetical protein